ncbi:MAG: cyclic nucleotide-binding domain-containing protein [Candidatus Binataceae bacterium]
MHPTPLQTLIGLGSIGLDTRLIVEAIIAGIIAFAAFAVRGRLRIIRPSGLVLCALGFVIDMFATPREASVIGVSQWASGIGLVFVVCGLLLVIVDAGDAAAHRTQSHSSTIFKDLLKVLLCLVVVLAVLRADFQIDVTALIAIPAVASVVLGFALQETLGNIFSGLTLQLGKPFAPGDWVRSGTHVGLVQGIGWRSTAMVTRANEKLEIPNAMIAKDVLINYSNGVVADEMCIGLSYEAPPNYVREVVGDALRSVSGVLQNPPPEVFTWEYTDFAVRYRIRYWMSDYANVERVKDTVATGLWYALKRKAIEIPYPIRTLRMESVQAINAGEAFDREIVEELRGVDFLRGLNDEELHLLVPGVTVQKFGAGEVIVREGDQGNSLFIIRAGRVEVVANGPGGKQVHIRDLARPAFFGEIAVMTGEPRNATIRARTDAELLELNRDGFIELFKNHPETAAQMGEVIALRMGETRDLLAAAPHSDGSPTRTNWLLGKMRSVFNIAQLR